MADVKLIELSDADLLALAEAEGWFTDAVSESYDAGKFKSALQQYKFSEYMLRKYVPMTSKVKGWLLKYQLVPNKLIEEWILADTLPTVVGGAWATISQYQRLEDWFIIKYASNIRWGYLIEQYIKQQLTFSDAVLRAYLPYASDIDVSSMLDGMQVPSWFLEVLLEKGNVLKLGTVYNTQCNLSESFLDKTWFAAWNQSVAYKKQNLSNSFVDTHKIDITALLNGSKGTNKGMVILNRLLATQRITFADIVPYFRISDTFTEGFIIEHESDITDADCWYTVLTRQNVPVDKFEVYLSKCGLLSEDATLGYPTGKKKTRESFWNDCITLHQVAEPLLEKYFIEVVSSTLFYAQNLSEAFLESKWPYLKRYYNYIYTLQELSEDFIFRHLDDFDFTYLLVNYQQSSGKFISIDIIEKVKDRIDWKQLNGQELVKTYRTNIARFLKCYSSRLYRRLDWIFIASSIYFTNEELFSYLKFLAPKNTTDFDAGLNACWKIQLKHRKLSYSELSKLLKILGYTYYVWYYIDYSLNLNESIVAKLLDKQLIDEHALSYTLSTVAYSEKFLAKHINKYTYKGIASKQKISIVFAMEHLQELGLDLLKNPNFTDLEKLKIQLLYDSKE